MSARTRATVLKAIKVTLMEQSFTKTLQPSESLLKDICPDSLDRVEVLIEIEDDFNIRLNDEFMDLHAGSTIQQFSDAVFDTVQQANSWPSAPAN